MFDFIAAAVTAAAPAADIGILLTGLLLGIRHGIDWDHIAAITDITSTTAAAGMAEAAHDGQHETVPGPHHGHGGDGEIQVHDAGPGAAMASPAIATRPSVGPAHVLSGQGDAIRLGTMYALGHGVVVIALGLAAIAFGAILPDWLDPIMGRIVGFTLVVLGLWVLYSDLSLCQRRRGVPAAQSMDAGVRRHPPRLARPPGTAPRPRTRRAARDELVRRRAPRSASG